MVNYETLYKTQIWSMVIIKKPHRYGNWLSVRYHTTCRPSKKVSQHKVCAWTHTNNWFTSPSFCMLFISKFLLFLGSQTITLSKCKNAEANNNRPNDNKFQVCLIAKDWTNGDFMLTFTLLPCEDSFITRALTVPFTIISIHLETVVCGH